MREKVFFAMPRNYQLPVWEDGIHPSSNRKKIGTRDSYGIHELAEDLQKIRKTDECGETDLQICLSREVFEETFEGDWNEWIDNEVNGVDYYTRRPKYGVIVCVTESVGKATSRIVEGALAQGKPVFLLENNKLQSIAGVETLDRENWQGGWKLIRR